MPADATAVANLDDAIANITAQIADATASPKPTYSVGGQSVSWESYMSMLSHLLEMSIRNRQMLAGPVEYRTFGVP